MRRHPAHQLGAVLLLVLWSGPGWTRETTARLRYRVADGLAGCPAQRAVEQRVAQHLGFDPWRPAAQRLIEATIAPVGEMGTRLRGEIRVRGATGRPLGHRALETSREQCGELAASMALAISIAIDPLRAQLTAPTAAPAIPPATTRPTGPPPKAPTTAPPTAPTTLPSTPSSGPERAEHRSAAPQLTLALAGLLALGAAPATTGGVQLQAALRWSRLALGVEGRFDAPGSAPAAEGQVSAWLAGGALVGCGHFRQVFGCAVLVAAAVVGRGHNLVDARRSTLPYLAAGLRTGLQVPLTPRWHARVQGELLVPFGRVILEDSASGRDYWTSPRVSGSLGLGLVLRLR